MVAQQHLHHHQRGEDQNEEEAHQLRQVGPAGACQALETYDSPGRGGHELSR